MMDIILSTLLLNIFNMNIHKYVYSCLDSYNDQLQNDTSLL